MKQSPARHDGQQRDSSDGSYAFPTNDLLNRGHHLCGAQPYPEEGSKPREAREAGKLKEIGQCGKAKDHNGQTQALPTIAGRPPEVADKVSEKNQPNHPAGRYRPLCPGSLGLNNDQRNGCERSEGDCDVEPPGSRFPAPRTTSPPLDSNWV